MLRFAFFFISIFVTHLGVSQDSLSNEQQQQIDQSATDEQVNFSVSSTNSDVPLSQSMWDYFPENRFIDSLREDTLISRFRSPLEMQFPSEKTFNGIDPYDPYMLDSFARNLGFSWLVSLLSYMYYTSKQYILNNFSYGFRVYFVPFSLKT